MSPEIAVDEEPDVPLWVLLLSCFEWLLLKLLAMDNVEEAADNLDTNVDFTIMYTTNTVEYRNVNVFEIV